MGVKPEVDMIVRIIDLFEERLRDVYVGQLARIIDIGDTHYRNIEVRYLNNELNTEEAPIYFYATELEIANFAETKEEEEIKTITTSNFNINKICHISSVERNPLSEELRDIKISKHLSLINLETGLVYMNTNVNSAFEIVEFITAHSIGRVIFDMHDTKFKQTFRNYLSRETRSAITIDKNGNVLERK